MALPLCRQAGDICAVFGVDCSSGDAFSDRSANLAMSKMHVPDTVVSMGLLIKEKNKVDSLLKVLAKYSREDPTFRFNLEQESGQIQISGPAPSRCPPDGKHPLPWHW